MKLFSCRTNCDINFCMRAEPAILSGIGLFNFCASIVTAAQSHNNASSWFFSIACGFMLVTAIDARLAWHEAKYNGQQKRDDKSPSL